MGNFQESRVQELTNGTETGEFRPNRRTACHYMQHPKSYDLTFKLAPRFALFIIGGSAAVRQGFGK